MRVYLCVEVGEEGKFPGVLDLLHHLASVHLYGFLLDRDGLTHLGRQTRVKFDLLQQRLALSPCHGGGGRLDRQTDTVTGRQTDRQTDRHADRQADRQTDRQIDRHTEREQNDSNAIEFLNLPIN